MDCDGVRDMAMEALTAGRPMPERVAAHVRACGGCRQALDGLKEVWSALGALPLMTPSAAVGRRLVRRVRREGARRELVSVESWRRGAFAGVSAFVLAVLLSLLIPFEAMANLCRAIAPSALPTPAAYLLAGLLYGILPMIGGTALPSRRAAAVGGVRAFEAALVFMVVLTPYVLLRCGEFPLPLLAGFIAGIALGAAAGGVIGLGLRHRVSW